MEKYIAISVFLALNVGLAMAQTTQVEEKDSTVSIMMLNRTLPQVQKNNLQINQTSQTDLMLRNKNLYKRIDGTNKIDFDKKGNMRITEYNVPGLKYQPQTNSNYNNAVGVDVSMFKRKKK